MTNIWNIIDWIFIIVCNPCTLIIVALVGFAIEIHDEKENDDVKRN